MCSSSSSSCGARAGAGTGRGTRDKRFLLARIGLVAVRSSQFIVYPTDLPLLAKGVIPPSWQLQDTHYLVNLAAVGFDGRLIMSAADQVLPNPLGRANLA